MKLEWKKFVKPSFYYDLIREGYGRITSMVAILAKRESLDEVKELFENETPIPNERIDNIQTAEKIIMKAIEDSERICVFGDYDADGVTSSAILHTALKTLGAEVLVRLPDRFTEGYGISIKAIDEMLEKGVTLFITVDNGIRAINEIAYAREKGAKVIVLDHHEPGEDVPDCECLIDLKMEGTQFPDSHLTGAGLAFKVSEYLLAKNGYQTIADGLVDLAAIGTIADVETLTGENRVIVKRALRLICVLNFHIF